MNDFTDNIKDKASEAGNWADEQADKIRDGVGNDDDRMEDDDLI